MFKVTRGPGFSSEGVNALAEALEKYGMWKKEPDPVDGDALRETANGVSGPVPPKTPDTKPDMVHRPAHYVFPGGVEVIHLSQHLTSNGGQAVQYIARSTRLDGDVKGKPVEDLRKAIVLLECEIERLSRESSV